MSFSLIMATILVSICVVAIVLLLISFIRCMWDFAKLDDMDFNN